MAALAAVPVDRHGLQAELQTVTWTPRISRAVGTQCAGFVQTRDLRGGDLVRPASVWDAARSGDAPGRPVCSCTYIAILIESHLPLWDDSRPAITDGTPLLHSAPPEGVDPTVVSPAAI